PSTHFISSRYGDHRDLHSFPTRRSSDLSQGLASVLNTSEPLQLNWDLATFRNEKSVAYENRYTELIYEYQNGKDDYLGQGKEDRSEEHTSELQSRENLVCRLLLEKKKQI